MIRRIVTLLAWIKTEEGKKAFRYSLTSVISAVISQLAFLALYGLSILGAKYSSISATLIGAVPSYFLNRYWAFEKKERNHFFSEVVPYFIMAVLGLVASTWSSDFADSHRSIVGNSRLAQIIWVDGAYFGAFAVLWVAKYFFLRKFLFGRDQKKSQPVVDTSN
ncbi:MULTISPECIES: GtrA family protein [Acidithrix]|uniref:GtrA-like protein n=1 Tax=Acidithrix ferrooxidans TaxID=1280514 RepID=A0A0D8HH90_9ACTN|nr:MULTISPECIES: GtrA family protein [Acidithrix]KJF17224.1 GtrA-like protein [Acidithrix ferrooxidans]